MASRRPAWSSEQTLLHTPQASCDEAAPEGQPGGTVLARSDI